MKKDSRLKRPEISTPTKTSAALIATNTLFYVGIRMGDGNIKINPYDKKSSGNDILERNYSMQQ